MKKKVISLVLAAALVAALLVGCGGNSTQNETNPPAQLDDVQSIGGDIGSDASGGESEAVASDASAQHAKVTMDTDRMSVNPMGLWASSTEVYSMYEMLFQTENGIGSKMVPVLADGDRGEFGGYDHETGTGVYTFYIQPEIYDHAGNHLTASDVCFSFEKTRDYGQTSGWGVVQSWEAVDDTTVKMTCERELINKGELENIVLRCFMFTEAAYNASASTFNSDACGTGPYKLNSYTSGASVSMVKYENYWQKDSSKLQRSQWANVDEIELICITEDSQKVVAVTTDTTDLCQNLPAAYVDRFADGGEYGDKFDLVTAPANGVFFMEANCDPVSVCNDVNLRMAIMYAVGSEELCKGLGENVNVPLKAFGVDVFPDYNSEWDSWENYQTSPANPEKAAEYLAMSNYNGEELVILSEAGGSDMAVLVQNMLSNANINSTLVLLERFSLNAVSSDPSEWDIFLNSTRASDYLANIWSHVMNSDAFPSGKTEGFVDDAEYQELLKNAMNINATATDMDAFWQYTLDNAFIEGTNCSKTYIAYPSDVITGLWMNDKSVLLPGTFVYAS